MGAGRRGWHRACAAHYFSAVGPAELGTGVGGVSPPAATLHFTGGPTPARTAGHSPGHPASLASDGSWVTRVRTLTHRPLLSLWPTISGSVYSSRDHTSSRVCFAWGPCMWWWWARWVAGVRCIHALHHCVLSPPLAHAHNFISTPDPFFFLHYFFLTAKNKK